MSPGVQEQQGWESDLEGIVNVSLGSGAASPPEEQGEAAESDLCRNIVKHRAPSLVLTELVHRKLLRCFSCFSLKSSSGSSLLRGEICTKKRVIID